MRRLCANKFVRGLCELPKIKCGDCGNQAFIEVNDAAVLDHLQGRHVMGVYPLLEDETCWLLAVDFDKGTSTRCSLLCRCTYRCSYELVMYRCRRRPLSVPNGSRRTATGSAVGS